MDGYIKLAKLGMLQGKEQIDSTKKLPNKGHTIMRGSVYYQTSQLTRQIFKEGAKKYEKIDPDHLYYKCVSSYKTMETYRSVWDNFGNYLKEHWKLKDFEKITAEHIDAYISYKIEYYLSKQYLEKIVSALGKLQDALEKFSMNIHGRKKLYDFSIRQNKLHYARVQNLVADGYRNRVYSQAELIIENLSCHEHKLAAKVQLEGGARSEGVTLIREEQLITYAHWDKIEKIMRGAVLTKEKGGKEGEVLISTKTYYLLERYVNMNNGLKINYQVYADDIRQTCLRLGITPHGSHGFRWTFAQNRVRAYQDAGYSYEQALQGVSWEMKHFRASITEHYLG